MTRTDRIILCVLAVGVWVLTFVTVFDGDPVHAAAEIQIEASEIDGLRYFITDVVEYCTVTGEVYIYDREGGHGQLDTASIDC